ncbi:MAG TPA: SDR family oxidoreductase [Bacteroidales bacterium]|nr:SDR family oxidoreductase [Bacteroidales bacterium]HPS17655.1 SDR family oxidoreductase [Bacteroidales bacterium]
MSRDFILITGAASGIGQKIAVHLSRDHRLLLCDKNRDGLNSTLELCSGNAAHLLWEFDLSNVAEIRVSIEKILKDSYSHVEAFVHSAGIMKVMRMKDADYQNAMQIFNVNFFSAAEIISSLLKKNINQNSLKNIIFISAILGKFGARGHNLYSSTKAALDGLMKSLAVELAPAVRVNSILPGGVRTPMAEYALTDPDIVEKIKQDYPLGLGETSDIANLVEFLLSEKSRWITGQQIIIDGGRTANMSQK